jgi:thiol-disulfide isomerase/thioredoxin
MFFFCSEKGSRLNCPGRKVMEAFSSSISTFFLMNTVIFSLLLWCGHRNVRKACKLQCPSHAATALTDRWQTASTLSLKPQRGSRMNFLKTLPLLLLLLLPSTAQSQDIRKAGIHDFKEIVETNKGKVLIINFWATWCAPCVKEFPGLMNLRKEFSEDDLTIIGISLDYSMRPVENFVKLNKVNFPIFLDDESIGSMLSIKSIPRTLIYNRAGEKILDHLGFISEESFRHVVERLLRMP